MNQLAPHRNFLLFTFSLMAVGAIVVALQLLASAGTASADHDPVTICHVDGQGVGHTITVDDNALVGHFNENDTPREGHLSDYMGACLVTEATSTATAAGQTIETPTATTTNGASPTATMTTVGESPTATMTTEAATSTATEVPATATETPASLLVVTNTPETVVSSESLGGTQGGGNGAVQQGVSGAQGGGNGAVSGAAQLPSTGTGGAGSSSNGMLYFGIALIVLGAGLGGTRILLARR